jgi:photosystem II stability/assembly factor-like uncharacterized protein
VKASAATLLIAAALLAAPVSQTATATATHPAANARIALDWLQMIDTTRGYALSGENPDSYRLLWTTDGGRHWTNATPGQGTIHPSGPLSMLGQTRWFSTKLKQGVFAVERSDNAGRSWRRSLPFRDPHGQGVGQPFALDSMHLFLAVDEGAAAGSQGEALYTTSDGGHRWQFISRTIWNNPPRGSLPVGCDKSGFGFATPTRGWAGGYCPGGPPFFYRTDNGGRSWDRQRLPAPGQCACETSAPLFFTPNTAGLYVTGFAENGGGKPFARVLWTRDGGNNWQGSDPPAGRVEDVSFADAQDVWIIAQKPGKLGARFDLLLRTDDAGTHWQTITLRFNADAYRLDALSSADAYAFKVGVSSNLIIFTHDGGHSWHTIHATMKPT